MTEVFFGLAFLVVAAILHSLNRRVEILETHTELQPGGCPHSDVKNIGTFGHPEYECTLCHQTVDLP